MTDLIHLSVTEHAEVSRVYIRSFLSDFIVKLLRIYLGLPSI